MMKRLAGLLIVLAVTLPVNAALTDISLYVDGGSAPAEYTMDVGEIVSVAVYSGNTDSGQAYISFEDNGLWTYSNVWPQDTGIPTYNGYTEWEITVVSPTSPGIIFSLDFSAEAEGTVEVNLYDSTLDLADSLTMNLVPEPITLVLLGAGGVVLLRRRKK